MIQKMTKDHIFQVCSIENQSFSDPWSKQGFLDTLKNPDALVLVDISWEGYVLGYVCLYQGVDEGDIVNVAVAEKGRRQGVGMRLVEAIVEEGKRRGIDRFFLEVRRSNDAAKKLYEKCGFDIIGIRKRFYEKPVEDALVMSLDVN